MNSIKEDLKYLFKSIDREPFLKGMMLAMITDQFCEFGSLASTLIRYGISLDISELLKYAIENRRHPYIKCLCDLAERGVVEYVCIDCMVGDLTNLPFKRSLCEKFKKIPVFIYHDANAKHKRPSRFN